MEFTAFPKIARLSREIVITEKIDGTNASIYISDNMETFLTGSRTRWITPDNDNAGFSRWAYENKQELLKLGPGHHFGEWWGKGIQRGYGLDHKKFSLFNVGRWNKENIPSCVDVVPVLYKGMFTTSAVEDEMHTLKLVGSFAAPGYNNPEGVIVFHTGNGVLFKKTFDNDKEGKGS
jgi:hypothetical protein